MTTEPLKSLFAWQAHPAREHAGRALIGVAVIAALATLAAVLMQSPWWGLFAALVLVLALNRFFFASRFTIDEEGITARYPLRRQRLRWSDLRRFAYDRYGGYLSTRAGRSRLDAFRGMHVLFGHQRDPVIARIREQLGKGGSAWAG